MPVGNIINSGIALLAGIFWIAKQIKIVTVLAQKPLSPVFQIAKIKL